MKIFITGQHASLLPSNDSYGFPSRLFYNALSKLGISWGSEVNGSYMISINHNSSSYKKFVKQGYGPERCILLRTEPESVFPAQYSSRVEKKYGLILSPGKIDESPITHQFYEFQEAHGGPGFPEMDTRRLAALSIENGNYDLDRWKIRKINVAMIASNKFSPLRENGYKLRREIARNIHPGGINIYGKYWNHNLLHKLNLFVRMYIFNLRNFTLPFLDITQLKSSRSINALGEIELKSKILPEIKFLLVIENSMNVLTEKLFDAMLMGAIPIYVGPNLDEFGIPKTTYISVNPNSIDISKVISELSMLEVGTYLDEIKKFITSDHFFDTWCDESPYVKITMRIQDYINSVQVSQ
jgi:hypothetical protein